MIKLASTKTAVSFVSLLTLALCLGAAYGIYSFLYTNSATRYEGVIAVGIYGLLSLVLLPLYLWLVLSHRKELTSTSIKTTAVPFLLMIILTVVALLLYISR